MKQRAVSGIMLSLLLIGMLILTLSIQPVKSEPTTIIVPDDYEKIQWAIGNASDGDTIFVKAGTYYEKVVVDKTVSLIGENKDTTIIDGQQKPDWSCVYMHADNSSIRGFTIQNASDIGVKIFRGNVTIENNLIKLNRVGVYVQQSENNVIKHNSITDNDETGIDLYVECLRNVIDRNNITENGEGITLFISSNNTISGNKISTNNGEGICIRSESSNNIVFGNTFSNNEDGIYVVSSSDNAFIGNTVTESGMDGIYVAYSSANTITGNNVTDNGTGIRLVGSDGNTITGNNVTDNWWNGLSLQISSSNNLFRNIIAHNTQYGIWLAYGSNGNTIYHNTFIDNRPQILEDSYNTTWDNGYPSGGNYWSNYTGVDSDHDGIGDTTHEIDVDNVDNYPLMGMFSDFNATPEHNVQTICNSTISDFHFHETAISFNVSGEDGTTGFCRISIPTALMNDTYKVFVNGTEVPFNLLPCSNSTHSYLYFTYDISTQEVIIIPEFTTWTPILLILIVLTVMVAIYKRRLLKTPIQ